MDEKTINELKRKTQKRNSIATGVLCLLLLGIMIYFSENQDDTEFKSTSVNMKFSEYTFYIPDNQSRYQDFKRNNPIIRNKDVVWMVNVNLDRENYENPEIITDPHSVQVLVNKHFMLEDTYVPEELTDVGYDQRMIPEAADALESMISDAGKDGMQIVPQSGYRSYNTQSQIFNENKANDPDGVDTYSARPGHSEHQTGLAMDLNVPYGGQLRSFVDTKESVWVAENAYKYGFIVRYTDKNTRITGYMAEPWHVRYIGIEHSGKMQKEKIDSFEEYKAKYLMNSNTVISENKK